ncbi:ankyrin repeat domain-containing protein, partial [bacterium]|nr:ankyrin repeat domain-containing protein [bacterium]
MKRKLFQFLFLLFMITCFGCRARDVNEKQTFQTEEGPVHYYLEIITINSGPSLGMRKLFTWIRSYLYIEQNGNKKKFKIHLFNEAGGWAFGLSNKPEDWCHMEKTQEKGIYRLYIGLALRESVFIVNTINGEITETDELFYAVRRNDIEAVKKRLEMDDVNKVIYTQNTALHRASSQGYNEIVKLLLEKGANAEIKDQHGMTPLNRAAQNGQLAAIILLLDSGAKISGGFPETTWTPLFNSVFRRHCEACEILLKRGANPNIKDEKGRTPLDIAIAERKNHEGDIRRQGEYDKIIELL